VQGSEAGHVMEVSLLAAAALENEEENCVLSGSGSACKWKSDGLAQLAGC